MTIKGFSAHLNSLYAALDEADACRAAARDGFRCVEIWAPPQPDAATSMIESLSRLGLSLASVNTDQGPDPDGFGRVSDPAHVEWWRRDFLVTLGFARHARAESINVLVGGRRRSAKRAAQRRCLIDNLGWALDQLTERDPILLLEPLNGADRRSPMLQRTEDALAVITEMDDPRLRLLFDAYHLFQEEDDLIRALHLAGDAIGHVQIADYPGRAEPGTGEIPIGPFLTELAHGGYRGWVGLEYFPSADASPFAWLRHWSEFDDKLLPEVAS
jgi:hydroxypyruvate isomerase